MDWLSFVFGFSSAVAVALFVAVVIAARAARIFVGFLFGSHK